MKYLTNVYFYFIVVLIFFITSTPSTAIVDSIKNTQNDTNITGWYLSIEEDEESESNGILLIEKIDNINYTVTIDYTDINYKEIEEIYIGRVKKDKLFLYNKNRIVAELFINYSYVTQQYYLTVDPEKTKIDIPIFYVQDK